MFSIFFPLSWVLASCRSDFLHFCRAFRPPICEKTRVLSPSTCLYAWACQMVAVPRRPAVLPAFWSRQPEKRRGPAEAVKVARAVWMLAGRLCVVEGEPELRRLPNLRPLVTRLVLCIDEYSVVSMGEISSGRWIFVFRNVLVERQCRHLGTVASWHLQALGNNLR